jgi:hypothetical protein
MKGWRKRVNTEKGGRIKYGGRVERGEGREGRKGSRKGEKQSKITCKTPCLLTGYI